MSCFLTVTEKNAKQKNEGFFGPLLLLSRFRAGAHTGKKEGEKGKTEKKFFTATAGPARSATAATAATAARAATVTRMTLQNFYYIITVNKRYLRNRLEQFKRSQAFLIIHTTPSIPSPFLTEDDARSALSEAKLERRRWRAEEEEEEEAFAIPVLQSATLFYCKTDLVEDALVHDGAWVDQVGAIRFFTCSLFFAALAL